MNKNLILFHIYTIKKILDKASIKSYLYTSCKDSNIGTVDFFLGFGLNFDIQLALYYACGRDDNMDMVQLLLAYPKKKNPIVLSTILLTTAVEIGDFDTVRLLVDYGADVKSNSDILDQALESNHFDVAEYLFADGATVKNFNPKRFIQFMAKNESMVEMVEFFVAYRDTKYKPFLDGKILTEALIVTCKTGTIDTIQALIDAGANIHKSKKMLLSVSETRPHIHLGISIFIFCIKKTEKLTPNACESQIFAKKIPTSQHKYLQQLAKVYVYIN